MKALYRLAFSLSFAALAAWGQSGDGNVVGQVTDASGAAVAGATVTIQNVATNIKSTTKTETDGSYRLANLLVGDYNLTVEQAGFRSASVRNVKVDANRTGTVNVTLELGQVTTTVEVRDAGSTVDTTTATVVTNFNARAAEQLPISAAGGLGVLNLSLLSAGVSSSGGAGYGTGPSVGGQRPTNNNFMVEGVDNNNRSVTGPIVAISNEAVSEFTLQQNQFAPEFGHSTGGQFNTVIKSGSNQLHGSVYEYFQNRDLNAVDQAFKRQGIFENPRFDNNRFGGTLGGPIIRNKWFIFGNYEYNPIGQAATNAGLVETPTQAGIATLRGLGSQISQANLTNYTNFVPAPATQFANDTTTVRGLAIPLGVLQLNAPSYNNNMAGLVSSDFNLSEKDQFRARYAYNRGDFINTTANLALFFVPYRVTGHIANFTWLHSFSPTFTNELRAGWNRRVDDRPIGNYSWPGLDAFPNLSFNDLGLTIGPNSNYPQSNRSNTYQLADNASIVKGRHTIRFGYDGRKLNITNFFVQRQRGDYIYNSFERFMLDVTPEFAERSAGGFPFIGNLLSHYAYANDEWRVKPNLTLTLGVRYEFVDVPAGAKSQELNALASVPGLLEFRAPKPTYTDFTPRVGIAWSPGNSGKTSIRAGFGMAYDQVYQNLGTNSLPPQYFTTIDAHIERPDQPNFLANGGIKTEARPITSPSQARALTSSFIPDQVRPYSLQWNVGVQRVLANDYTLEVRYLGSRGVHLPYQVQMNRPAGVTADRNLPLYFSRPSQAQLDALTLTRSQLQVGSVNDPLVKAGFTSTITTFLPVGNSSYHGLATQLNKRFSRGFQFTAAYTLSSLIDDSTAALNSTVTTPRRPQDFANLRAERAHSALDHRHRASVGWLYTTPWYNNSSNWWMKNLVGNWTFSGTYIAETGSWATFRSAADSNLNGDNAGDRTVFNPNGDRRLGSGTTALTNSAGQTVAYLANNPNAAWVAAPQGVLPNAGRDLVRFPMINNVDAALGKRFSFGEGKFFEIRGEFYNALNHPQYIPGFASIINPGVGLTQTAVANALIPTNTNFQRWDLAFASNARLGQIVARIQW